MKKLSFLLLGLIIALSGMSQNYFETFVRSDDGILREGKHVVETTNHGYIISFNAKETLNNEMIACLSPEGEVVKQLVFQIDGKNLKYFGLYRHPENENEILAIATLYEGNTMNDFIQKEIAFIRFDEDLNIISQTVSMCICQQTESTPNRDCCWMLMEQSPWWHIARKQPDIAICSHDSRQKVSCWRRRSLT